MIIKPLSSFNAATDSAADLFPSAAMLFHADDVTAGDVDEAVTWTCRVTGNVLTITPASGQAILKDSEGVYTGAAPTLSIAGTMPTVLATHYAIAMGIGSTTDASTIAGAAVGFGISTTDRLFLTSAGGVNYNTAALNTAPTLSPAALTTAGRMVCGLAYFDFVDTTFPRISRIISNNDFSSAVSTTFAEGTTTSTAAITPGEISQAMSLFSMGTAGARHKIMALFLLSNPVTYDELKVMATVGAQTLQIPAMLRNRS